MPHCIIAGMTTCGKTFFARGMAAAFMRRGVKTLVLHKNLEPWAPHEAAWQTPDPDTFMAMFLRARGCACFMEMSDANVAKYSEEFRKAFTEGRHYGHRCHALVQRAAQIHPDVREQVPRHYIFACVREAAEKWAKECDDPELLNAVNIPYYYYYEKLRRIPAVLRKPLKVR